MAHTRDLNVGRVGFKLKIRGGDPRGDAPTIFFFFFCLLLAWSRLFLIFRAVAAAQSAPHRRKARLKCSMRHRQPDALFAILICAALVKRRVRASRLRDVHLAWRTSAVAQCVSTR